MVRRVIIRPEAEDDLNDAFNWYEAQCPGLGREFAREISRCIDTIAESPMLFARMKGDIRRALANRFPFVVYYLANDQEIIVLAVLHCARNPELWKSRI